MKPRATHHYTAARLICQELVSYSGAMAIGWKQFTRVTFWSEDRLHIRMIHLPALPLRPGQVERPEALRELWERQTGGVWGAHAFLPAGAYDRLLELVS